MITEREAFEEWLDEYRSIPNAFEVWQAACAYQREKDAKVCDEYATDRYALYKGRPPYNGKEPQRCDPHTEGASDGADKCADKIRSGA